MHNNVTYLNLRHMLGYIDDHQVYHQCHHMTLDIQVCREIFWHKYVK